MVETGHIVQFSGAWGVITYVDFTKEIAGFKVFKTYDEAYKFTHDCSLAQVPFWHEEHCDYCKEQE